MYAEPDHDIDIILSSPRLQHVLFDHRVTETAPLIRAHDDVPAKVSLLDGRATMSWHGHGASREGRLEKTLLDGQGSPDEFRTHRQ